ncbi:hypothetical protein K469DRAFT_553143 [Zopfia rhizophila CBS 207.26]|uniref:Rhodopsin domain-containing protein n=1 Tax=Zopfia rhizophila CBS 207.26 TaxID=1314779 RepID=A0A6A6ELT7_9PEZI|nr:hypothetical protein K469DRAFT_553143 [Zopfia rhizophila CBS 207.26]
MALTQNFPDENEGPAILGTTIAVTTLALFTLIIRLYVRFHMIKNVGWDDYVMMAAMCLCVAGQAIIIPQVHFGAGRHINHIPPKDFQTAFKLNFISQPIYLIAISFVKLSIGFFLLRVAVTPFYRRTIISVMVFMALYTTACFLTILLQCTNLAVQWDPTAKGTCWGATTLKALGYTNAALNITTDLLFAIIIPIPMILGIQMNRRTKGSIIGILGLGIFATAAALVKVGYLTEYGKTGDWLWDSRNITIWTVLECNIGVIAGNLPTMKPIFRRVLGLTYGRGSRDRTTPKYLSRPYAPGTGHHSAKNYNSLYSDKTQEGDFRPYGADETHMMTNITAHKERSTSRSSFQEENPGKTSTESVSWLNDHTMGKMRGITKTTEVNVSDSGGPTDSLEEVMPPERRAVHMV